MKRALILLVWLAGGCAVGGRAPTGPDAAGRLDGAVEGVCEPPIEIAVDSAGAPHVLYAGADGSLHLAGPP